MEWLRAEVMVTGTRGTNVVERLGSCWYIRELGPEPGPPAAAAPLACHVLI